MSEFRKAYGGNLYFVTLTVTGWVDIFSRSTYKDIIVNNLQYCQENENPPPSLASRECVYLRRPAEYLNNYRPEAGKTDTRETRARPG